ASKRKSGRDATVAEAGHDVGFRLAGQAGVSQPFRQFGEEGFVHIATIQPQRPLMAHCVGSHLAGQTVAFAAKWSEADHGLSRALAAIDFAAARQISMTCRERSVSLREPCLGDRRLAVYSGFRLAALTTLLHFSVCSARCFPNSEGEATNGLDPQLRKSRLQLCVGETRVDLLVQLIDKLGARVAWTANTIPGARLISRYELAHAGDIRQRTRASRPGRRERTQPAPPPPLHRPDHRPAHHP